MPPEFTNDLHTRRRDYPINKVKNGKRYILNRGDRITFPSTYPYNQYLVGILLPTIIGHQLLTDGSDPSVFRKMVMQHIQKSIDGSPNLPVRATNSDAYVLQTASDLELLYLERKLTPGLLKRLQSKSNGEMRGVIYELAIAAAFMRAGYTVEWLPGTSLPEFTATKISKIDVEAKRRNRTVSKAHDIAGEIRAVRQLLRSALRKSRSNPYLIFIDSDLPPQSTKENQAFYLACEQEFRDCGLENTAMIITNSGFEHDGEAIDSGKNSVMVFQGKNSPDKQVIHDVILWLHAELPAPISASWSVD